MESLLASLDKLDLPAEVREGLRKQLTELLPAPLPGLETLKNRLSLLRTFTEKSYRIAARDLPEKPSFEAFVASSDIEPLIGYEGRFAVTASVRSATLDRWLEQRDECARCAGDFVQALDATDPIERFDRLQILFLGDQAGARRALIEAFNEADQANDIAQCSGLLELVAYVRLFFDAESTKLLNQIRGRAQARNLFFTEFYQSERYYPRKIDRKISEFALAKDDKWIFHLYAPGGVGKTTMLRRLISHEWIVGPQHAPCAVLDFDYLDVSTVLQQPALLGLAMAAQWNEQLEQPVFGSILSPSFRPLASLLFRTRSDASARGLSSRVMEQKARGQYLAGLSNPMRCGILAGAVPPRTLEERTALMQQTPVLHSYWTEKLPEAIAMMPTDRPILLVLDTLEDASLSYGQQLLDTLKLISRLRESARQLATQRKQPPVDIRLILSGRHRLGKEHIPQFTSEFADQYIDFPLDGLAAPEAIRFLGEQVRRDVDRRAELIRAMVAKAQGIPFNLSLFAEWANDPDDKLTPEIVASSEDVSTVMLIERTIKRIQYQPLRWVIRYGTVPRFLSEDYLREVMRQPLLDAMSGKASSSGADDPQSATEQDVWIQEPGFQFDATVLWNEKVRPYIAERNWIGPGDQPHQAVFRGDILQPMRKLLCKQRIFATLHEQSRDWFKRQRGEPGEWNAAAIEVLYHSVQLRTIAGQSSTDLLPALQELLDDETLRDDPKLRAAVCEELRKPDFSELTLLEQGYVCYRLAEAQAAERGYFYTSPDALQTLSKALDLTGKDSKTVLPPFAQVWRQLLDSTINLSSLVAATGQLPMDDLIRAVLLIAERFFSSKLVEDLLRNVTDISLGHTNLAIPSGVMAGRLARYIRDSDPKEAARYFAAAAKDFGERGDNQRCSEMLQQAAAIELGLGRLGRAQDLIAKCPLQTLDTELQRARIELAKGNPGEALSIVQGSQLIPDSIEKHEISAEALSQRMLLREAADAWDRATLLASKGSDAAAFTRIAVGQAKLYYWWMRISPDATPDSVQSLLRRSQDNIATSDALTNELEVWQIAYGRQDADRWRRRALGELGGNTLAASVRLIFALSQVVTPLPAKRWDDLITFAKDMVPSARIAALAEPVLAGSPPQLEPAVRDRLADTFRGSEPRDDVERAWYGLRFGELLAWLGLHHQAAALLEKCVPKLDQSAFGQGWRAAVYRQRRRVEQRIREWLQASRAAEPYPPPDPDRAQLWWIFWQHTPFRAAAALVENAERARLARDIPLMHECLQQAEASLQTVRVETAFHSLARRLNDLARDLEQMPAFRSTLETRRAAPLPTAYVAGGNLQADVDDQADFDVVAMVSRSGRVVISTRDASESNVVRRVISGESATLEILLRSRGIPRRLIGKRLDAVVSDLVEFLNEAGLTPGGRRTALRIPLSPLSCAPWELAYPKGSQPFRLPSEWNPARAKWEARGIEDLRTLAPVLFAPISGQDKESPALPCYLALSVQIRERLEERSRTPAHLLYVASSFIELPGLNEPALAGVEWTSTTLAHTITGAFQDIRPFVILDVPLPVTLSDFTHQLLMRNYFAHALVDSGAVSGVLATGLHPLPGMAELQKWLLQQTSNPEATKAGLFDDLVVTASLLGLQRHDALFTASPNGQLCSPNFQNRHA